jgi:IS30 family transposase
MRRPRLSAAERAKLWARWKQGERLSDIATALGRAPGTCKPEYGRPTGSRSAPPQRAAKALERAPSTVRRAIARNGGGVAYRAVCAERAAWRRAARPKPCKLGQQPRLRRLVAEKLEARWSPQQIRGWLPSSFPAALALQVSHETICQTLTRDREH